MKDLDKIEDLLKRIAVGVERLADFFDPKLPDKKLKELEDRIRKLENRKLQVMEFAAIPGNFFSQGPPPFTSQSEGEEDIPFIKTED